MSELPASWTEAEIGEVCDLINGRAFKPSDWTEKGLPIVRIQNLNNPEKPFNYFSGEVRDKFLIDSGDLLFAWSGTPGTSFGAHVWNGGPAVLNQHIFKVEFNSAHLDRDFFCYAINQKLNELIDKAHGGVGLRHVTKGKFEETKVSLPPFPEQKRIARKLNALSARTTTARTELKAIPALVERYKLSFLRSVFSGEQTTKFREESLLEPVGELLERIQPPEQGRGGRKPTDEVIPGKGGISVNDPGSELPQGWDWVPLLRVARQETGHTPSRSHPEWWGGDVCWISIPDANAHHGQVIYDTTQKTNEAGLANSSARLLPADTVVLSRTASVGYVTIMGSEMATSQDFVTWTCSEALEPKYLMYALLSEGADIRNFGEGTTHTTIYYPEIRAFNIKLAPLAEQREIIRRIETSFDRIDRLAIASDKSLELADRLDQCILARAFAGELVSQDPMDEPASELLNRIRDVRADAPKKMRQRRTKANTMKNDPKELLLADSVRWPQNGLPFEDVAKRIVVPYDDLRDALFELLGGVNPKLEQVFDRTEERMRLKRVGQ